MKIKVAFDVYSYSQPKDIWVCNLDHISMSTLMPGGKRYMAVIEIPDFIPEGAEKATVLEAKEES